MGITISIIGENCKGGKDMNMFDEIQIKRYNFVHANKGFSPKYLILSTSAWTELKRQLGHELRYHGGGGHTQTMFNGMIITVTQDYKVNMIDVAGIKTSDNEIAPPEYCFKESKNAIQK